MRYFLGILFILLSPVLVFGSTKIAITFDDLPLHGALPPGETRVGIATKILSVLQKYKIPEVYGFMNGKKLQDPKD